MDPILYKSSSFDDEAYDYDEDDRGLSVKREEDEGVDEDEEDEEETASNSYSNTSNSNSYSNKTEDEEDEDNDDYHIAPEKVLNTKTIKGSRYLLVKWKGERDPSWIEERKFEFPNLVKQYAAANSAHPKTSGTPKPQKSSTSTTSTPTKPTAKGTGPVSPSTSKSELPTANNAKPPTRVETSYTYASCGTFAYDLENPITKQLSQQPIPECQLVPWEESNQNFEYDTVGRFKALQLAQKSRVPSLLSMCVTYLAANMHLFLRANAAEVPIDARARIFNLLSKEDRLSPTNLKLLLHSGQRSIDLESCGRWLSDDLFRDVVWTAPALQNIGLSHCELLSPKAFKFLAQQCANYLLSCAHPITVSLRSLIYLTTSSLKSQLRSIDLTGIRYNYVATPIPASRYKSTTESDVPQIGCLPFITAVLYNCSALQSFKILEPKGEFPVEEVEYGFLPTSFSKDLQTLAIKDDQTTLVEIYHSLFTKPSPNLKSLLLSRISGSYLTHIRAAQFPQLEELTLYAFAGPACKPPLDNWRESMGESNFPFNGITDLDRLRVLHLVDFDTAVVTGLLEMWNAHSLTLNRINLTYNRKVTHISRSSETIVWKLFPRLQCLTLKNIPWVDDKFVSDFVGKLCPRLEYLNLSGSCSRISKSSFDLIDQRTQLKALAISVDSLTVRDFSPRGLQMLELYKSNVSEQQIIDMLKRFGSNLIQVRLDKTPYASKPQLNWKVVWEAIADLCPQLEYLAWCHCAMGFSFDSALHHFTRLKELHLCGCSIPPRAPVETFVKLRATHPRLKIIIEPCMWQKN